DGNSDYDPARDLIAVHRLIQAAIRNDSAMTDGGGQQAWCSQFITAINNEVTSNDYYSRAVRRVNGAYTSHIRRVVEHFKWQESDILSQRHLIDLLSRMVRYLDEGGAYQTGIKFAEIVIRVSEVALGVDHSETATSLNNLGDLYHEQGKYDQA